MNKVRKKRFKGMKDGRHNKNKERRKEGRTEVIIGRNNSKAVIADAVVMYV